MGSEKTLQPRGTANSSASSPSPKVDQFREQVLEFNPPRNSGELQISETAAQGRSLHDTDQNAGQARATHAANSRDTAFRSSEIPGSTAPVLHDDTNLRPERHEPEMDSPERKPRRGAKTKRMKKRYSEMMSLREEVSQIRQQLMPLYQDLNAEVERMRESEEVLLSSLEGEMRDLISKKPFEYLRAMWDEVQTSRATFNDTIARALQFENVLRDPQEELIVAEDAFLEAAETVVASKSAAKKSDNQAVVPDEKEAGIAEIQEPQTSTSLPTDIEPNFWANFMTPSEASALGKIAYEVEESDSEPLVLSRLRERQVFLRMSRENLNELECEQEDDRIERDLMLDRGDEPTIPESEFEGQYIFYREKHVRNINKALSDIERLKAECLAQGIDPDPLCKPGSPSSTAYLPKDGEHMSVNTDLDLQADASSMEKAASAEEAASLGNADFAEDADSVVDAGQYRDLYQYRDLDFEASFGSAPVRRPAEQPTRVLEWLQGATGERNITDADEKERNTENAVPDEWNDQSVGGE